MIPIIKNVFSSDVKDWVSWKPDTLSDVDFPLELTIGPSGQVGGENFEVLISTPEALRAHPELGYCFSGQHILIVMSYDWTLIYSKLEELGE